MSDDYELFGAARCEATLPTDLVTEEQTFGQFVTLAATLQGSPRFLSLAAPDPNDRATGGQVASDQVSVTAMLQAGAAEGYAVGAAEDYAAGTVSVDQSALDSLLASGTLKLDWGMAQFQLQPQTVATLMKGMPADLHADTEEGPRTIRVEPASFADFPAVTRHEIADLADFIANPIVPGQGGLPFQVALTPELVGQLRTKGRGSTEIGGVELVVTGTPVTLPDGIWSNPDIWHRFRPSLAPTDGPRLALFLPWKQRWELLGYSRGLLLHSLSLAPQEETTIELFTWDRRKRSLEQESETEAEETFERADITKDTADVVQELTNSNEFQVQADARVRVTYPVVHAEVGAQLSNKQNIARISKRTSQHLAESTSKAATRVKTRRKTRITESTEFGREERVTRKVKNANMCRALNLDYFEVVANYEITVRFAEEDAALCVLIDMPGDILQIRLNELTCRVHETALRAALLERSLASGFDAARFLAARELAKGLVCDKVRCSSEAGAAQPPADSGTAQAASAAAERPPPAVTESFDEIKRIVAMLRGARREPLMSYLENHPPSSAPRALVDEYRRWIYWSLLTRLITALADALEAAADDSVGGPGRIAYSLPAPGALSQPGNLTEEPPHKEEFERIVDQGFEGYGTLPHQKAWWWGTLRNAHAARPYDQGLAAALERFSAAWRGWQAERQSGSLGPDENEPRVTTQQLQQQRIDMDNDRLEYAFPLKETAEAQERLQALISHLGQHKSYYRYAILQAMPLGDQMQLLASQNAPLELCEPRVIGMIQGSPDRLAVPLNLSLLEAGESREELRMLKQFAEGVLADLRTSEVGERRVSLPTPGIALETRLGSCDACEPFIAQSRAIDLEQRRGQVAALQAATALQQLEARRYEARLGASEAQLDDPRSSDEGIKLRLDPVKVVVEQPPRP